MYKASYKVKQLLLMSYTLFCNINILIVLTSWENTWLKNTPIGKKITIILKAQLEFCKLLFDNWIVY